MKLSRNMTKTQSDNVIAKLNNDDAPKTKKTKNVAPIVETTTTEQKLLTVADVARELKIEPKTARAYLRRKQLKFAKNTFFKSSQMYADVVNALKQRNMPTAS